MNEIRISLPDSRMRDPKGCVVVDWPDNQGGSIRLELEPIFCFNCGAPNGYVPRGLMTFVSWLCAFCSLVWGKEASLHSHADQEFWDKVYSEMIDKFGRALTQEELERMAEKNSLPSGLALLDKESPYRKAMKR